MHKKLISSIIVFSLTLSFCFCQQTANKEPASKKFTYSGFVKKLDGDSISIASFSNGNQPLLIVFWATTCMPCKEELDSLNSYYSQWQQETGVKLIAISIDKYPDRYEVVKKTVASHEWKFDVYIDNNEELYPLISTKILGKKITSVPKTYIYNKQMEEVYYFNGFPVHEQRNFYNGMKKALIDNP